MRILMTRGMARFVRREEIADAMLREAIERAEKGLIDADLGGGLIKQRVARPGKGRSGGYRTIVAYRRASKAIFLYGFAKSERDNIEPQDLADLRLLGAHWLGLSAQEISVAILNKALKEVGP